MKKNILIIAFEMPPARSAGVQRPFRFAQYLLEMGWNPIILTAEHSVYQSFDYELEVPSELDSRIHRAKAYDIRKKLSVFGKIPGILLVPDRYWPWYFPALKIGQELIEKYKIDCIWSTYPVMTAHLIARKLSKNSELPWIADFRDPLQCHYNSANTHFNALNRLIEQKIVKSATSLCFTTQETVQLYRELYPKENPNKFHLIENGFVEMELKNYDYPEKFTLLYSGNLYTYGRDITSIFRVLQKLKLVKIICETNFKLVFRGAAKPKHTDTTLKNLDISELVEFLPSIPFQQSIDEMQKSSANMLIQDEIFNFQIPGKFYDYVQSNRPILALCPEGSATARACSKIPNCWRVWSDDEIESALISMLSGKIEIGLDRNESFSFSRRNRAKELANLLTESISKTPK